MTDSTDLAGRVGPRRRWRYVALSGAGGLALALGGVWGSRDRIAADAIDRELASLGLPARYHIDSIGLGREVISAVAVGDPAHPDLTVDRVEIVLRYGTTGPVIDRITLVRPRLAGRLVDGRLQFGSLDRLIYAPSSGGAASRLPNWALALVDARARIDSDYGAAGFSADGSGNLFDGFAGTVGVVVPGARFAGSCSTGRSTLFAQVSTRQGRPGLHGPLRVGGLRCGATRVASGLVDLAIGGDDTLSNWTANTRFALGRIDSALGSLAALHGNTGLHWQAGQGDVSGRVTLDAQTLASPAVRMGAIGFDGVVHARPAAATFDVKGNLDGRALARGPAALAAFDRAGKALVGTPFAPLLAQLGTALWRQEADDRLAGSVGFHGAADGWRVTLPSLRVRSGTGGALLAQLDRLTVIGGDGQLPRFVGNFASEGPGLPTVAGTMSAQGAKAALYRVSMAPYAAGGAQLAVPGMTVTQAGDGSLGFVGTAALSGPVTDGRIDGLTLPIDGAIGGNGRIALMRHCITPGFARLRSGTLDLMGTTVRVCPVGGAIVRSSSRGVTVAALLPSLDLHGRSGDQAIALHAGAAHVTWPGTSRVAALDVTLGKGADANRVRLSSATVTANGGTGGGTIGGMFSGGDVVTPALPADVSAAAGLWQWGDGRLTMSGGQFVLTDRISPARFAPVAARAAAVSMAGHDIDGSFQLVAPGGGAELARVTVQHDVSNGRGHADAAIAGLVFHQPTRISAGLQPTDLSDLAKGVVANVEGTVRGNARFDWDGAGKITSGGRFGSDDLDFAAAVGPVDGLAGTIVFTDLLGLVSAPHQILKMASINPGIEVDNGVIDLQFLGNDVVRINQAKWPFEGGTLLLEPADLNLAVSAPRKLTLIITGLEAGRFIQHINVSNLSVTGTFDGHLPLTFDANGGRITGGKLISRAPGGNVSYVGALTYRDLSPMGNYAFKMLRSVDYKQMAIGMEGDLGGEVITKVSFGGISQGAGATRNLITRQIARLPLRFDINVRAQFYQLLGSLRSLYDPSMVRDPRDLGLVDAQGRPVHHHGTLGTDPATPATPVTPVIQPQASGTMP